MEGVESLLQNMSHSGCSPLFMTSALCSLGFGELGRRNQENLLEDNIAFKEKMLQLKKDFSEERINAQVDFRRESYELGRKYQAQMMRELNESRRKEAEFRYLCEHSWPLTLDVSTVMKWQEDVLKDNGIIPLRVLVAKTDVNSYKRDNSCYANFCSQLNKANIPNIVVEQAVWKTWCQSPMAESLNINYVMQGIPTLALFPYKQKGTYHLEYSTWSFNRGLGAIVLDKAVSFPYSLENADDPKIMLSLETVIGVVRDIYMVFEYQKPAIYPSIMKAEILQIEELRQFLNMQYKGLKEAFLSSKDLNQLCSDKELRAIEESLNINFIS